MTTTATGLPPDGPEGHRAPQQQPPATPRSPEAEATSEPESSPEPEGTPQAPGSPEAPGSPATDAFADDLLPTPKGASRTLLASLLAPHRRRVRWVAASLLLQQAAVQAGPLLVAYALDSAVPALRAGDHGPLIAVAVAAVLCAVASGGLQFGFIQLSARVSQDVLLDLRGRIFRHAQALSLDFHERYTSGRLISRATTDVESLRELLEEGLQELITVALSTIYITATLIWLDWGFGAAALVSAGPLALLVRSFRHRSHRVYSAKSTAMASVIVKFTETLSGIRPVQAFRRERPNDAAFARLNHQHARINGATSLEMARYVVSSRLVANTTVAALVLWAPTVWPREGWRSVCWQPVCSTSGGCTTPSTGSGCSSTPMNPRPLPSRRSPVCWPCAPACRSPRHLPRCRPWRRAGRAARSPSTASGSPTARAARCCPASI